MREGKLYIGGKFVNSSSRKKFISLNPANERPFGRYQLGNKNDVDKAVQAAKKALPLWKKTPAPKRAEILFEVVRLLKKHKERLAKLEVLEMGKVYSEATGDVQEAIDVFEYMAGEGRRLFGYTTPSELKNKFCMTIRIPLGVVGLITPWNFPIAIPAWKLAPALICGNTCVLKPSSDTPGNAIELIKILEEAGLPKGVVNLVTGSAKDVGEPIVKHSGIQGLSFTGSVETGKFIVANAGLKKVGLELGGKNAIIVMEDADLNLAVDGIVWGGFGTTGQRCTAASRVIVHKKVKKELEERLLRRVKRLRLGSGLKRSTDVGPLINEKAVEKSEYYTQVGKKQRAKLLCGGERADMKGFFFKPTLFTNVKPKMRIAQEEIFGPVVSLIPVSGIGQAIRVCNGVSYGLSSAIYTKDIKNAMIAAQEIETGLTYINSSTIGSEVHLPFGGVKDTGNGREAGIEGIHEFSETKVIYIDYSGKLQKAQID
ncbi:MAG: aldehyde dehydrogenase family protein [Candidatus Woesearchaeota archaeon]